MSTTELLFASFTTDYEQIGKLRFKRYGDLLGGELEEMERHQRQATVGMLSLMTLAKRISDAKQIPFEEVMEKLTSGNIGNDPIIEEFGEEVFMVVTGAPMQAGIESEMITLFIQSRAEIEGADGWQPMESWTMADTKRLPGKFRRQVLDFIGREQDGKSPEEQAQKGKPKASAKP